MFINLFIYTSLFNGPIIEQVLISFYETLDSRFNDTLKTTLNNNFKKQKERLFESAFFMYVRVQFTYLRAIYHGEVRIPKSTASCCKNRDWY